MWNKLYANRFLNEEDKFYDHKLFCERIALSKSHCNTSPPAEFRFLKIRAKKKMMEKDKQKDTLYNNNLLIKKMIEMERKPQQYHPKSQKFYPHPESLRFSKTSSKHHEYLNAHEYLKRRITSAKSAYSREKSLKDYQKKVYVQNQLLKNSQNYNPYIHFATPDLFKRSLYEKIMLSQGNEEKKRTFNKKESDVEINYNKKSQVDKRNKQPAKYEIVRSTESDDIDTRMITKYSAM